MSNKFTAQQIQNQFASLPTDMQQVISSANTASLIQDIGGKHGLRIDAIGTLIEYSGLIMLGLIKSDEFVDALVRETGVKREMAANLALDIDTQVFSQVRNSIKQVQYKSTSDRRFEQNPDFQKPVPVEPKEVASEQINTVIDTPIPPELNMSSADYNPSNFASTDSPDQSTSFGVTPVASSGSSALAQAAEQLDGAFATEKPQAGGSVEIQLNTNNPEGINSGYDSASVEQEVSRSMAKDVMKGMPGAVQDAYKAGQAAAPAPVVEESVIKDFQTRLEEKIAQSDTTVVNSDPYKESI